MSNSWFQFKEFTIQQEKAAMKVCTDACLFGAWVADKIESEKLRIETVLDIGTGTGLLSLMIAQKLQAKIDAVEIDEAAAQQAKDNFSKFQYKKRLNVIQADIRNTQLNLKYDVIISNPPFYKDGLKSENIQRNIALHSEALSFEELITSTKKLLNEGGYFFVLLPFNERNLFINIAKNQCLFLTEQAIVKQTEKHSFFRSILMFSDVETEAKTAEIIIKENGKYSEAFIALLKDYYLHL